MTIPIKLHNHFAGLGAELSSQVSPQPLTVPALVSLNSDVVDLLQLSSLTEEQLTALCNGEQLPDDSQPCAMVYAGHQFGSWVPRLGDGRAMLLGETDGIDGKLYDLQIKGAGLTPYSRMGDGRAVLRSTIREFLCSEAMHGLGIPTTRSLCLINSSTLVYREKTETAAAMVRVAESHVRFGSFEYFSYSNKLKELSTLTDHVIHQHFPQWNGLDDRVERLLAEAVKRTAELIACWQAFGWCHGVMNTDNMSILGLTIDYGPFGFLDGFDANHICNHSDGQGRYAFSNQPHIGHWNCAALAQALLPLLKGGKESAESIIDKYPDHFAQHYSSLLRAKFGFSSSEAEDNKLIDGLFHQMQEEHTDYTLFFRNLCNGSPRDMFTGRERFDKWYELYLERLAREGRSSDDMRTGMLAANPKYILRNHLLQIAIDRAEEGDYSEVNRLLAIMRKPFEEQPEFEDCASYPPDWASKLEISCSS